MKVIALTLCLAALAQARITYRLRCTRDEVGIRWPSYQSNSEYYVCPSAGSEQMTAYCRPGELFSFVLQECTSAAKFIPPPPIEILPTAAPITIENHGDGLFEHFSHYPRPQHMGSFLTKPKPIDGQSENEIDAHPPVVSVDGHQLPFVPKPAIDGPQVAQPEVAATEHHVVKPVDSIPSILKPVGPVVSQPSEDNEEEHAVPLPPTPAPTPPSLSPPKKPGNNKPAAPQPAKKPTAQQTSSAKKPVVPQAPTVKKPTAPQAPTAKKPAAPQAPTAKKPVAPPSKAGKKPAVPTKA